ncbi:FUSC family protein [Thioclava sp. SK-1]|uniref:FUSC family protein n=1 Tax=Thioclava sp. SK-1 TaxID=1889770 RepID=UPI00159EFB4B|nr:FUSC family protein [Thioclava sp. SK-1]
MRLFSSAICALALAQWFGFHNPYWAVMPVWVVSQPVREDMALRAVLRVLGTLAGAAIGLAALTWLHSPALIALAVGLTVAIGVGAAYRIGTTYSYGFLMMAISVGVIVMPSVGLGADGFIMAVERLWCTLIGVVAVTAISWIFTPARRAPVPPRPQPHSPRQMVLRACAAGGLSAIVTFLTGWTLEFAMMTAALSIVVFSSILGQMHDPRPVVRMLLPGVALGIAAAITYRALAQSMGGDPTALFAMAVAFIAAGALLRAHPKTAAIGLDANMCFLLGAEIGAAGHPLLLTTIGATTLLIGTATAAAVMHQLASLPERAA